jgi:hypothetical protein
MIFPVKFMLRVRDIERVQLTPDIYEILTLKSIEKIVMEKWDLLDLIERFSPEVRC